MRFEEIDKKIKEAAEQHHPAYDEKAWQKMEKLLNEHLPQPKKDNRRILFILLMFLLIGGGLFIIVSKPTANSKDTAQTTQEKQNKDQARELPKNSQGTPSDSKAANLIDKKTDVQSSSASNLNKEITPEANDKNFIINAPRQISRNSVPLRDQQHADNRTTLLPNKIEGAKQVPAAGKNQVTETPANPGRPVVKTDERAAETIVKAQQYDITKNEVEQPEEMKKPIVTEASPQKGKSARNRSASSDGLSFSVSIGPDVSKAASSPTGKTAVVYGAGIGYTRNRFTLRTGVYAAKKIYWADPSEYKLSYAPPPGTVFEGADANCYVINIPVKLSYNFEFRNKSHWFAGAGLSSYLMKRESYVYKYKTAWSYYEHPYEIRNENKHYFSVLNLSGGYSRDLNKRVSISAEPYLEVPLTGIGAGKVHLGSAGMLFTIGVKPFKK